MVLTDTCFSLLSLIWDSNTFDVASAFSNASPVDVCNASDNAPIATTAAATPATIRNTGLTNNDAVNAPTDAVAAKNAGDDANAAIPTAAKPNANGVNIGTIVLRLSNKNFTIG